jgi:prepilin-type N-terminal cleavage/methylation domain-containing protein
MNRNRGFTIIELMIVIVIAAIGIALAVPSFSDIIERKQLGGATDAAFQHLQRAKSQAIKRSKSILVDFNVNGTDWAIGFTDKMAGCNAEDPVGANACTVDENNDIDANTVLMVMRVSGSDYNNVTMSQFVGFVDPTVPNGDCASADDDNEACFDFLRGLSKTGQYDFDSANYKLRLQVTMMGNVVVCIPTGEKKMTGYQDCGV